MILVCYSTSKRQGYFTLNQKGFNSYAFFFFFSFFFPLKCCFRDLGKRCFLMAVYLFNGLDLYFFFIFFLIIKSCVCPLHWWPSVHVSGVLEDRTTCKVSPCLCAFLLEKPPCRYVSQDHSFIPRLLVHSSFMDTYCSKTACRC